jgi:hypothetical protein
MACDSDFHVNGRDLLHAENLRHGVRTRNLGYQRPVKSEILTSYIYGPTFGNAEIRLFLFSAQCFNTELMQKVILWHSCV